MYKKILFIPSVLLCIFFLVCCTKKGNLVSASKLALINSISLINVLRPLTEDIALGTTIANIKVEVKKGELEEPYITIRGVHAAYLKIIGDELKIAAPLKGVSELDFELSPEVLIICFFILFRSSFFFES